MNNKINSEVQASYTTRMTQTNDDEIVDQAMQILSSRIKTPASYITCPEDTKRLLKLKMSLLGHEVFYCVFLDNKHGVLEVEEMFRGTIDVSSVYPREVVKRALEVNAAAVIFAHNHPSGVAEPSKSDENITIKLRDACALVDIRVLDHLIIAGNNMTSLAEMGII